MCIVRERVLFITFFSIFLMSIILPHSYSNYCWIFQNFKRTVTSFFGSRAEPVRKYFLNRRKSFKNQTNFIKSRLVIFMESTYRSLLNPKLFLKIAILLSNPKKKLFLMPQNYWENLEKYFEIGKKKLLSQRTLQSVVGKLVTTTTGHVPYVGSLKCTIHQY